MNFFVINLKKNLSAIICIIFLLLLIFYSNSNIVAAQNGILLWANSVLPTLFPFFIAAELLYRTNFVNLLGKLLNKFMRPVFNIPGESAIAIILGNISGYPVGAKMACNLKESNVCTKEEAERIISFTNNSGPLFILGTVGITMFSSKEIGILLYITHFLASITVGVLFRNWKKNSDNFKKEHKFIKENKENLNFSNLGEILGTSIKNSIELILTIGGFIVLFSVIISILNKSKIFENMSSFLEIFNIPSVYSKAFLSGILELTNGLKQISSIPSKSLSLNILLGSFILGFGGISVLLQVCSIISKHNLSIKPYLYGKILQAIIATIYTLIILLAFPSLCFNI